MEGVANVHLDALEHGIPLRLCIRFRMVLPARVTALPLPRWLVYQKEVIKRARLRELESLSPNATATQVDGSQMSLLMPAEETSPAVEALEKLDPDSLTPRQALEWIYRLKNLV